MKRTSNQLIERVLPRVRVCSTHERRRRARGAVLVESIIVAVAMVLFLVAFLYVHQAWTRQLQVQKTSRAAAFAFAMNACEGDPPTLLSPEDQKLINAPRTAAGSSDTVADGHKGEISEPAAASALNKATAKNTGFGMPAAVSVSARGNASATDGHETMSSTMHSRTTLLCNEKPREGTLEDSLGLIGDFLKF